MKILVAEDSELIRTMLRINLERHGFQVTTCESGEMMLDHMQKNRFDVVLLDIMLPGMPGDEALNILRRQNINTPVLMLTVKRDTQSKVRAFEKGADDYLSKPFDMEELIARVRALLRRSQGERSIPSRGIIYIDSFEINLETGFAETNTGPTQLTDKEVKLLAYFARNPNRNLSRNDILEEVWGLDVDPTPRTIDNFIVKFRKLFEVDAENPRHFITIRFSGYRFEP
ncbi:response regulator transcription factor [bacterium]|nr:response regulator transcription factor [candidate division CSSED10-310 bacterium]